METSGPSYVELAIEAYIRGEIGAQDLQFSLGRSPAQTRRLVARYRDQGSSGLISNRCGNRNRAHTAEFKDQVICIIADKYPDFSPVFAQEKLKDVHGLTVGVETLRRWMIEASLYNTRKRREPKIFSPRARRERRGELVQVDGSYHRWFEKRGSEACILTFIDDATSEIMLMLMVQQESSFEYMRALKKYIETHGRPQALYSDRHAIFKKTQVALAGPNAGDESTQFSRACGTLDIVTICASTPQAKGRVERSHRTSQDRLIKELRLRNISTIEEAN